MVLRIDSDAACLAMHKAKSCASAYYYLSDNVEKLFPSKLNESILVTCKILRHVDASSVEAYTAGVFPNAQAAIPIRHELECFGCPQPETPLKTDNSTDNGHAKRSKAWDIRQY